MKPKSFEVFQRMVDTDDHALMFGPLSNVVGAQLVHKGRDTHITIGMPGEFVTGIAGGDYVGGLILCKRTRYERK